MVEHDRRLEEDVIGNRTCIVPATADRWGDLEAVLGPKGGAGGCWCMLWRIPRKDYDAGKNGRNRQELRTLVHGQSPPGLIAYVDNEPAGWCSVAPRSEFPQLARSRILKPIDDVPVWSISCFVIVRHYRLIGLSVAMLGAAAEFARDRGGTFVEGYPVEPHRGDYPAVYAWTGLASAYRKAGFTEVGRRSPTRPIMRKSLAPMDHPELTTGR